jgi:hypothetical protein
MACPCLDRIFTLIVLSHACEKSILSFVKVSIMRNADFVKIPRPDGHSVSEFKDVPVTRLADDMSVDPGDQRVPNAGTRSFKLQGAGDAFPPTP